MFFPSLLPLVLCIRVADSGCERAYKRVCVCMCVCHGGKCVHAVNARGPLIVSRTSARRIDLSHGKRQIAVRRTFGSRGLVAGLGQEPREKNDAEGKRGCMEWKERTMLERGNPARKQILAATRSNLLISLFSSSWFC